MLPCPPIALRCRVKRTGAPRRVHLAKRPGTLLDLGGGSPFQGYIARESLGPKTTYLCLDIFAEAKPHVVADTLELPLANSSIDAIFCNAMLEHVREPQRAVDEMYRVLAHSGRLILSVPFIYPYHDRVDYYRFTDTALRHIFRNFDAVEIEPLGDYFYVVWLFLTGFHFSVANRLDQWFGGLRSGLRGALTLYTTLLRGRRGRNYLGSMSRSPVGWYVYCEKG